MGDVSLRKYHGKRIADPRNAPLAHSTGYVLNHFFPEAKFKSVLDIGSSVGGFLKALDESPKLPDLKRLLGIDGSRHAKRMFCCENGEFQYHRFEEEIKLTSEKEHFDIITCFEVAEHIKTEEHIFSLIEEVSHANTFLFFGAAQVGQRGRGHINCHQHGYWRKGLEKLGWNYDHRLTSLWLYGIGKANQENGRHTVPRCYLNTQIFQKFDTQDY